MTIDFYDGSNFDGLFNILGKAFYAQQVLNTARLTTVPDEAVDLLDQFRLLPGDQVRDAIIAPIPTAITAFQSAGGGLASSLQQFCRAFVIDTADRDVTLASKDLELALRELIQQMLDNSESVDASTVGVTVAPGGSNLGDGVIVTSTKRGDGLVQENAYGETINVTVASPGLRGTLRFAGDQSVSLLSQDWPSGSGCVASITAVAASSSLLANGDMEDEDDRDDSPDDWLIPVGTIGTTLKMTNVEVQTIQISGTPTGNDYDVLYTNAAGDVQTTTPLDYNATASAVQSALRALTGLERVTVSATGTSPNYTHTITFTGAGGNVAQLTSVSRLTGGSPAITHGTTSAGTAQVFAGGKAVEFDSNGSQLTTLMQRLTSLQPGTAYAVSLWAICDSIPAAGVFTLDLVDGVGGTVITDAQGTNNSFSFNAADLTTSWQHLSDLVSGECVFRTPKVVPDIVYFRLRISTAVSNTTSVFIDHVAMTRMTSLYRGGPLAAVFSGAIPFAATDTWEIAVTNNRAGAVQEWCNRNFNMAQLGLLLPSNSGGSETIPDSVVG